MTLIPPNVAALIEEADAFAEADGEVVSVPVAIIDRLTAALESAYASPARSLPTVEEVAQVISQWSVNEGHFLTESQVDGLGQFLIALFARESEAGQ